MPIGKEPPTTKFLYRGATELTKSGGWIKPIENRETIAKDQGSFVFAAITYQQALAYGIKGRAVECCDGRGEIYAVLLQPYERFDVVRTETAYLQRVESQSYRPVYFEGHEEKTHEWVSKKEAKVLTHQGVTKEQLVRYGVQVFELTEKARKELSKEDLDNAIIPELWRAGRVAWIHAELDNAKMSVMQRYFKSSRPPKPTQQPMLG